MSKVEIKVWLKNEVEMAEGAVATTEMLAETATGSERRGRLIEWRKAQVELRVARDLYARATA